MPADLRKKRKLQCHLLQHREVAFSFFAVDHRTAKDDNLECDIGNGEYAMTGGGGTAMTPIFNYVLDHQIECDCICILTDGYIEDIPTNPIPNMPVLWVITKDGTEDFCDWGQKIRLKNSDND